MILHTASPDALLEPIDIHIIGIGGAGMSSIATILLQMGHRVSGSDAKDSAVLARLRTQGATTFVGHDASHVVGFPLVVRSSAVRPENPELVECLARGLTVLTRTKFLPLLAARSPFVSISGTHGKTTTSSMTATALRSLGTDPGFLIGSTVHALGASGALGGGTLMVLEADESDGSFLAGPRVGSLVTNIEADHLDFWGSWRALVEGFEEFLAATAGPRVVCIDDPTLRDIKGRVGAIGYGFDEGAEYRIEELIDEGDRTSARVNTPEGSVVLTPAVRGSYNLLNATGSLALIHSLGNDLQATAAAIGTYTGVARRFERRGVVNGIELVDDYAHHPTELRAVLGAARSGSWSRVVAVFQPHRFTRTEALWDDFAQAFDGVDILVVTNIYPAGESPRPGIVAEGLARAIQEHSDVGRVVQLAGIDDAARFVVDQARRGDLVLSIGAGDITNLADHIKALSPEAESRGGERNG